MHKFDAPLEYDTLLTTGNILERWQSQLCTILLLNNFQYLVWYWSYGPRRFRCCTLHIGHSMSTVVLRLLYSIIWCVYFTAKQQNSQFLNFTLAICCTEEPLINSWIIPCIIFLPIVDSYNWVSTYPGLV